MKELLTCTLGDLRDQRRLVGFIVPFDFDPHKFFISRRRELDKDDETRMI